MQKKLISLIMFFSLLIIPFASAGEVTVSSAILLEDAPNSCTQGTQYSCDDSQFTTQIQKGALLSDNIIDDDAKLKQKNDGAQLSTELIGFSDAGVDDWFLNVIFKKGKEFDLHILPYSNSSKPDSSSVTSFFIDDDKEWYSINITDAVRESIDNLGYIKLRLALEDNEEGKLAELRFVVPESVEILDKLTSTFLQIIPQGPTQTQINQTVVNEWQIIKLVDINTELISNQTCRVEDLEGNIILTNNNLTITLTDDDSRLEVEWVSSVENGFQEGLNYEIFCDLQILNKESQTLKQVIYINNQDSILKNIQNFVTYIMQILGFLNDAQQGGNAELAVFNSKEYSGTDSQIVARATMSGVPITNTTCNVTVKNTGFFSEYISNAQMTNQGDGYFTKNLTIPYEEGTYYVESVCLGGDFTQRVFSSSSMIVEDGVRMQSLT